MSARTTRRLLKTVLEAMDRIFPEDESRPLGRSLGDWEDQADAFKRAVIPTLLE